MDHLSYHPKIDGLLRSIDAINQIAIDLGKSEKVFREYNIPNLTYSCFEAGFIRSVSWLYILYQESGRVNINFLIRQLEDYGLDQEYQCQQHITDIYSLRTNLQHSLDLSSERDQNVKVSCDKWFENRIGITIPEFHEQWEVCLNSVINYAEEFLSRILDYLDKLSQDESCHEVIRFWNFRCERHHEPFDFDPIITRVAGDMGMDELDVVKFRRRHYDSWIRDLELLSGEIDFELEARKRIESDLIRNPILPITGEDIMDIFAIKPGFEVKKLLAKAMDLYREKPCNKQELLCRLKELIDKSQ